MSPRKTGEFVKSAYGEEVVAAFVPGKLPPVKPPIALDERLGPLLQEAETALARLETATVIVPNMDWFIYAFVRKEAVVSSQVEGTQATLVDLLNFEADASTGRVNIFDVQEICNYLDALHYGLKQMTAKRGLPISVRLLNEIHKRLLAGARGKDKQPGAVRTSQNWIGRSRPGNAIYVPPPPDRLAAALGDLEKYIHDDGQLPALLRIGLVHVQFESIHPYLDGNGHLGRLLIALLLKQYGLLSEPLLYISLHFKRHRQVYYDKLMAVRTQGDWEGWLCFFLEGIRDIATETVQTAQSLFRTVSDDRQQLLENKSATMAALRLFEQLPMHPIVTLESATKLLSVSKPTANKAIDVLEGCGILCERSGKQRDRSYGYESYLALLGEETEILQPP